MSLRDWLGFAPKDEARAVTSLPWRETVPFNYGGSPVADVTQQRALSLGSVYAANRLLAQSIATLPLRAYRRSPGGREPIDKLPELFNLMVQSGSIVGWLHQCVTSLGLRGNAFGLITERDGMDFARVVVWLDPSCVTEDTTGATVPRGWLVNGTPVAARDIIHIPWFTLPGARLGLSPLGAFASTLGVALQAQEYASDWFGAGGFPPGTMRNTEKKVSQDDAEAIKARVVSAIRTHAPLVHGADWEYTPISVPPEEAQFVQTMKMTTNQIAAIYGIPPEMIGGESGSSMTYANVEQQSTNFVMFTLRPWLVTIETALSAQLPMQQYVKLNADALIRADLATRWNVNKIRVEMGAASIDEIRTQEDQAPLPNGQGNQYGPRPAAINPPATGGDVAPMRRITQ